MEPLVPSSGSLQHETEGSGVEVDVLEVGEEVQSEQTVHAEAVEPIQDGDLKVRQLLIL